MTVFVASKDLFSSFLSLIVFVIIENMATRMQSIKKKIAKGKNGTCKLYEVIKIKNSAYTESRIIGGGKR